MTLNVRVDNLRRSIRNDRMKQVYDQATAAGWSARLRGSGHIRMTAPNDKRTFLTISCTASGARSALNVEAVLKRWQREQEVQIVSNERIEGAIDRVEADQTLDALGLKHGVIPDIPEREGVVELTDAEAAPVYLPEKPETEDKTCPECGRTFKPYGYGAHVASHRRKQNGSEPKVAPTPKVGVLNKPVFTLDEIVAVANYGGAGGLIEVSKLRDGLLMVARMRGDA